MEAGYSYINFTASLGSAPEAIDELARRRGESGRLSFLASFFKSPCGVDEHDFGRQSALLEAWEAGQTAEQ